LNETFKEAVDGVRAWAQAAGKEVGRSQHTLEKYAGSLGAFLVPMLKGSREQAAEMSKSLSKLSVDLASFYNLADDDALARLQSGLAGETEAVRKLGVDLSEAGLQEFAHAKGITKKVQAMTMAEKIGLRYEKIFNDTTDKQGDASRTAGGYANTLKRLDETVLDLKVGIGEQLLPYAQDFLSMLNQLMPAGR
jgi:hypothetical protein